MQLLSFASLALVTVFGTSAVLSIGPRADSTPCTLVAPLRSLAIGAAIDWPCLENVTAEKKAEFQGYLVDNANDPSNLPTLVADVHAATAAASAIDRNFTEIATQLQEIDQLHFGDPFTPAWLNLRQRYVQLLRDSRNQAATVSQYADDFNFFLGLVNDTSTHRTDEEIADALDTFSTDIEDLKAASDQLESGFGDLANDVMVFSGTFKEFAKDRLDADNAAVLALIKKIGDLETVLGEIKAALIALGAALGGGLIVSGITIAALPLFAAEIMVASAVAAAIIVTIELGLVNQLRSGQAELANLNLDKKRLEDEISVINGANDALQGLAHQRIPDLVDHILLFKGVWTFVASDAAAVARWIRDGRDLNNTPPTLASWFSKEKTQYTVMVQALQLYADDIVVPDN